MRDALSLKPPKSVLLVGEHGVGKTALTRTALENAMLYRQLHLKALELDRMRAFNENILESLDDGLLATIRARTS